MKRRALIAALFCSSFAVAQAQQANVALEIRRATAPITIDGDLSDPAWKQAVPVDKWYETNPGDNVEPKAKSVGYLLYDDKFFYAGFEFSDPNPSQIRAPFADRDHIGGNTDDYAGVILDTRNDGKTGILFLANPRGIEYDAVSDDISGNEDSSPDFFWDAAGRITATGWTLELRIPFSSLRYDRNVHEWGVLLYRNMPRERRYQMFANRIPRGVNCFICNRNRLVGLEQLPAGGHMVTAPYIRARQLGETRDGLGSPFVNHPASPDAGFDLKWTPSADTALDATLNPDFSQVESDVAAIQTNQRFAINFPEKRPFFLEGVELFNTPIQAVYTRTITAPRFGIRSTGKFDQNAYTLLITQDRGGGSVILPSAEGSDFADQEGSSTAAIGRIRHDFGKSSIGFLGTAREVSGGAYNRVLGPDFQWKSDKDTITGQFLLSRSRTPDRPDLATEWDGRKLASHAGDIWYSHSTRTLDLFSEYKDYGDQFRADNGFVPQVGYRSNYSEVGYTFWPAKHFFSRIRTFTMAQYDSEQNGAMLYRLLSGGFGADGRFQSFTRVRYAYENVRSGNQMFQRHQLLYNIQFSINRVISQLALNGWAGQDVDFSNNRLGRGANIGVTGTIRPTNHLELGLNDTVSWLNVNANDRRDRLFTAQVERIRATYTFNNKMFARAIVQNQRTNRDTALYLDDVDHHDGSIASQILLAYKLNWQTLVYIGAGDLRESVSLSGDLEPSNRQVFLKVSYAFQR
ncbi:MAG: DUF5916 domain-containing protein [Thermoanaerobaculia bacterium]